MSLTIFDGFHCLSDNMPEILRSLASVRSEISVRQRRRYTLSFAREATGLLDRSAYASKFWGAALTPADLSASTKAIIDDQLRQKRLVFGRNAMEPWAVRITLWWAASRQCYLGIVRGEIALGVLDLLEHARIVRRYPYWDNADPDARVSPSEWSEREQAWCDVLESEDNLPLEIDLEADGIDQSVAWNEIAPLIDTPMTRAKSWAQDQMFDVWRSEQKIDAKPCGVGAWMLALKEDADLKARISQRAEEILPIFFDLPAFKTAWEMKTPLLPVSEAG